MTQYRPGEIIYRTEPPLDGFNYPYILGNSNAPPRKATYNSVTGEKYNRPVLHYHYFFATTSSDFQKRMELSSRNNLVDNRANMDLSTMLRWLIPFEMNGEQPYPKLFSRISLGEIFQMHQYSADLRCNGSC